MSVACRRSPGRSGAVSTVVASLVVLAMAAVVLLTLSQNGYPTGALWKGRSDQSVHPSADVLDTHPLLLQYRRRIREQQQQQQREGQTRKTKQRDATDRIPEHAAVMERESKTRIGRRLRRSSADTTASSAPRVASSAVSVNGGRIHMLVMGDDVHRTDTDAGTRTRNASGGDHPVYTDILQDSGEIDVDTALVNERYHGDIVWTSLCAQSIVGNEAFYDVIVLDYPRRSNWSAAQQDGFRSLVRRLRQRFPSAAIVFVDYHGNHQSRNEDNEQNAFLQLAIACDAILVSSVVNPPTHADSESPTLSHSDIARRLTKIAVEHTQHNRPERRLGTWGSGDSCNLWYDTSLFHLSSSPLSSSSLSGIESTSQPLQRITGTNDAHHYAVPVMPAETTTIHFHNPFPTDRMVHVSYLSSVAASRKIYPRVLANMSQKTRTSTAKDEPPNGTVSPSSSTSRVIIDPTETVVSRLARRTSKTASDDDDDDDVDDADYGSIVQRRNDDFYVSRSAVRSTAVGVVPAESTVSIQFDTLELETLMPFQIVGLSILSTDRHSVGS